MSSAILADTEIRLKSVNSFAETRKGGGGGRILADSRRPGCCLFSEVCVLALSMCVCVCVCVALVYGVLYARLWLGRGGRRCTQEIEKSDIAFTPERRCPLMGANRISVPSDIAIKCEGEEDPLQSPMCAKHNNLSPFFPIFFFFFCFFCCCFFFKQGQSSGATPSNRDHSSSKKEKKRKDVCVYVTLALLGASSLSLTSMASHRTAPPRPMYEIWCRVFDFGYRVCIRVLYCCTCIVQDLIYST